jgi:thiol-disulfide isomerase/thioredoxin
VFRKFINSKSFHTLWRSLKPWISVVALLLILRFTGALAGLSSLTSKAALASGLLDARPKSYSSKKERFDYNFAIKKLDGTEIDFAKYKGKTVFLNIWATWCGPCRAEMPSIQKLYEKVNDDSVAFVMLSIDREDEPQKVIDYIAAKGFTFPVFIAGRLPKLLQVRIVPSTFVIARDGTVAYKKSGMAEYDTDKFKKFLDKLSMPQEVK